MCSYHMKKPAMCVNEKGLTKQKIGSKYIKKEKVRALKTIKVMDSLYYCVERTWQI